MYVAGLLCNLHQHVTVMALLVIAGYLLLSNHYVKQGWRTLCKKENLLFFSSITVLLNTGMKQGGKMHLQTHLA